MSIHSKLKGRDLHSPSNEIVENNSGALISKMRCVTFNSIGTNYPQVTLAVGNTDIVRGIAQTDIANGQVGVITSLGFLNYIDTSAWASGTKLYCSITGTLTTVVNGLPVGVVLKQDAVNGSMYVDNTGVTQNDVAALTFPPDAELEMLWSLAYPTPYKEYVYNITGDIVDFNVYADNTKVIQVFNKNFSYLPNGNLQQITTTNTLTMISKTKIFTYNLTGEMISSQEA
jgi:hypothetical protein